MLFDKDKFATYLRNNAAPYSKSSCAKFVRRALEAGGADTKGHPVSAKLYGPTAHPKRFSRYGSQGPGHLLVREGGGKWLIADITYAKHPQSSLKQVLSRRLP